MSIVDNIRAICKERKIPVSKLERDLGFGNGYLNPKKIKTIDSDRLSAIAEYLNVSVSSLFLEQDETDEIEELLQGLKDRPGARILFDKTKNATAEQLSAIAQMIDLYMRNDGK